MKIINKFMFYFLVMTPMLHGMEQQLFQASEFASRNIKAMATAPVIAGADILMQLGQPQDATLFSEEDVEKFYRELNQESRELQQVEFEFNHCMNIRFGTADERFNLNELVWFHQYYKNELLLESLDEDCKYLEKYLLDHYVDPLHRAVLRGDKDTVNEILTSDIDLGIQNNLLPIALWLAAEKGFVEIVSRLLRHGVDIDTADSRRITALHRSAAKGHSNVVNLLYQRGAWLNSQNIFGQTPVEVAAWYGHTGIVQMLFGYLDAAGIACDHEQEEMLRSAAKKGNEYLARLVIQRGALGNKKIHNATAFETAIQNGQVTIAHMIEDAQSFAVN